MGRQQITCSDYDEFVEIIYRLVRHGLTFKADAAKLTINSGICTA